MIRQLNTEMIRDGSVTSEKFAPGSVITEKLADNSVSNAKLEYGLHEFIYPYPVASGEVITEGNIVKLINGEIASLHTNLNIDVVGIAKESKVGGEYCDIYMLDKSRYIENFTGLTPGTLYYTSSTGELVSDPITPPHYLVGIAVNETTLQIIGKQLTV